MKSRKICWEESVGLKSSIDRLIITGEVGRRNLSGNCFDRLRRLREGRVLRVRSCAGQAVGKTITHTHVIPILQCHVLEMSIPIFKMCLYTGTSCLLCSSPLYCAKYSRTHILQDTHRQLVLFILFIVPLNRFRPKFCPYPD